jgi:hypothetical protein
LPEPSELLKSLGINVPPGAKVHVGRVPVPKAAPAVHPHVQQPAEDLLAGIEKVLRKVYSEVQDENILGAIYSPHKSVALEIAKIMEAARLRDRKEALAAIEQLANRFRT